MQTQGPPAGFEPIQHAQRITHIGLVAAAALGSQLHVLGYVPLPLDVFGLLAITWGGWPMWRATWDALRERRVNMEMTMALGAIAAVILLQIATGALIVAFTLLSIYLEDLTTSRGKRAIERLVRNAPATAHRRENGTWAHVDAKDLDVGDVVRIYAGEKVPADGKVIEGHGHVDESAITGEAYSREKTPGSALFAGSLNGAATLDMRVERKGEDTTYARIIRLVREADARRGPVQRLADRVAAMILGTSVVAALATYAFTRDGIAALSVILVAGACGVAAGTPLAILATSARGATRGILYKGGEGVEALSRADTFVFDKTGTLTRGEVGVTSLVPLGNGRIEDFLPHLLAVEEGSRHPVALGLLRHHGPSTLRAEAVEELQGRGIRGIVDGHRVLAGNLALLEHDRVDTHGADALRRSIDEDGDIIVFVAIDGTLRGAALLRDEARDDAERALDALREGNAHVVMLTGDQAGPARRIARELRIDAHHANMLPEDKIRAVDQLRQEGRTVCYVGDGVNDAPALAAADVGVAVRHGSDVALESADVLLMHDDLTLLADAWRATRRARRVILFNFAATLTIDAIGMALAATATIGPITAAGIHVGSELALILNSARLFGKG